MKKVIAHRGVSALAPENTLASFALCATHQVKWVECDVDVLADGTVVLSHDDTFDRCTNFSGSLYDVSQAELEHIDAGSWFSDEFQNEPMPTLKQLIELVNRYQLNLNVEIKACRAGWAMTQTLIQQVIEDLEALSADCDLLVSSFNHLALAEFKRLSPETRVACLFEAGQLPSDWLAIAEACQADYINPANVDSTQMQIQAFIDAGFKVNVYTVNDLARANQLFNWGVEGIFSDIPHRFAYSYRQAIA